MRVLLLSIIVLLPSCQPKALSQPDQTINSTFEFEQDEEYQYALIGSNTSNYLWILSRTPQMEETTYQMLLEKATQRGYDISKLIEVVQSE